MPQSNLFRTRSLSVDRFPVRRWKRNPPETTGSTCKLNRYQVAVGRVLRVPGHTSGNSVFRDSVFDVQRRLSGNVLGGANHRAMNIHRHRMSLLAHFFAVQRVPKDDSNPHHHALASTPVVGCYHACSSVGRILLDGLRRWFGGFSRRVQSSSPQKSISGSMSSMPYSQPSTRSLPFHTITPAFERRLARLMISSCCSTENSRGITARQP